MEGCRHQCTSGVCVVGGVEGSVPVEFNLCELLKRAILLTNSLDRSQSIGYDVFTFVAPICHAGTEFFRPTQA